MTENNFLPHTLRYPLPLSESEGFLVLPRGLIRVSGSDRSDFLQGLVSNDLDKLTRDNAIYACLLTPQGKFLHDFFIVEDDDGFLIDCEPGPRRDDLVQRLTSYKLRSKVEIAPIEDMQVVVSLGDITNNQALGPDPRVHSSVQTESWTFGSSPKVYRAFKDPRHPDMGWRAIVPMSTAPKGDLNFEDWDYKRISLTIPDGSRDAEVGVSTLEELNIPRLNGVSFTKGCYVGQELTARMQNRNLGKRHLKTVKLGALPEGAELRSSCRDIGLALVRD